MFTRVWFIVKYWICWIGFFEAARVAFILSNFKEMKAAGVGLSSLSLWFGLKMDLSAAAYITLPVAALCLLSISLRLLRNQHGYIIYTAAILLLLLIIVFADIGLYHAWLFRIDSTSLKYLSSPREVWASVNHLPITGISVGFIAAYLMLVLIFKKLLIKWTVALHSNGTSTISFFVLLVCIAAFIIPIRGGFQLAPLNQSSVYFSQNNFVNMAALNAPWNFLHSVSRNRKHKINPFVCDDASKVKAVTDSLLSNNFMSGTGVIRKDLRHPNVLFIIWESLTAKVVGLQVGGQAITPGLNRLIKEGIYFSDIYATGDRTDKGIIGILSGYPAQATTSIIKDPTKSAKLPLLPKRFKEMGYTSSFHYGGELEFANMKSYLLQGKYDQFVTINDFSKKEQNSKWGAHDGVVADRLKQDISKISTPFFCTWLTLSSHEPYEIPVTALLKGKNDVSQFLSSIHYTDSIVYSFIEYAKHQPWWRNTLIVLVADHGHRLPLSEQRADDFKIPLLFLGGAIEQPFRTIQLIGSQTDIAATVLTQLNQPANEFYWSRNLLGSKRLPWAFFTFNNGFGFVQSQKKLLYDNVGKIIIEKTGNITNHDIYMGRAIQQAAFQDYLDR